MTYQEVGTWDLTDPLNPKFTPTGGLWRMTYRGLAAVDGSSQVRMTGYGIGGTIDGLRVEETLTRGAAAPFDPAIPHAGTAAIQPAPGTRGCRHATGVSTRVMRQTRPWWEDTTSPSQEELSQAPVDRCDPLTHGACRALRARHPRAGLSRGMRPDGAEPARRLASGYRPCQWLAPRGTLARLQAKPTRRGPLTRRAASYVWTWHQGAIT